MSTNITSKHRRAFEALTSGEFDNFALFSCFVNGEPTSAIVLIEHTAKDYTIIPLFIAVTPGMHLVDHDNAEPVEG